MPPGGRVGKGGESVLVSSGCCNKMHGLDGLNNRYFSLFWRLEVQDKVPADSVPGKSPLPGVRTVTI